MVLLPLMDDPQFLFPEPWRQTLYSPSVYVVAAAAIYLIISCVKSLYEAKNGSRMQESPCPLYPIDLRCTWRQHRLSLAFVEPSNFIITKQRALLHINHTSRYWKQTHAWLWWLLQSDVWYWQRCTDAETQAAALSARYTLNRMIANTETYKCQPPTYPCHVAVS